MNPTIHLGRRMSHRGINKSMIDFTLRHGKMKGDRVITNRKMMKAYILQAKLRIKTLRILKKKYKHMRVVWLITKHQDLLQKDTSVALKILDKGGVVVVRVNDHLITTYDMDSNHAY